VTYREANALITALRRPAAYDHPVGRIVLLETHISWVLLSGPYAYKVKKPVSFGFVDFSTLELRRQFCAEELRLNQRLAPDLYLDVVPILGPVGQARFGPPEALMGPSDAPLEDELDAMIDVAVRMRQFDQDDLLPAALKRGAINGGMIDRLAHDLACFQARAAIAAPSGPYGSFEAVVAPADANIAALMAVEVLIPRLRPLQDWSRTTLAALAPLLPARRQAERIREGHGDLHLGNMALLGGRITVFDALEFNPALRWIDVISDLAFLVMDLHQSGHAGLGWRLLNRWLESSGDYEGLRLWRWYEAYRALVRAKVAVLRATQQGLPPLGDPSTAASVERYLALAEGLMRPTPQALVLTHGVSGSGKSHHSLQVCERLGAIRIRSDVERKRLAGLWGEPRQRHPQASGPLYGAAMSDLLFEQRLPQLAEAVLAGGFTPIVDATFLRRRQRQAWAERARRWGVPLVILEFSAPAELVLQRIAERGRRGDDPSDADAAVVRQQWHTLEPLDSGERSQAVQVDATADPECTTAALRQRLRV
jgi:aminoglycoside phosphotransferase family enzyme/predicted kinase